MKMIFTLKIFLLMFLTPLAAEMLLPYLDECEKETCLQLLENIPLPDLWNHFLKIQTDLYTEQEIDLISKGSFWDNAQDILDLGTGEGSYLHYLSQKFTDKKFKGLELLPQVLADAKRQYNAPNLTFEQGDAEEVHHQYLGQFDVVLARLLLQHIQNPTVVLEHAAQNLKNGGHVIIVESYDPIWQSSHVIPTLDKVVRLHNERNKNLREGNRKISLQILKQVLGKKGSLSKLYEVSYSNVSQEGELTDQKMKFTTERERKLYFNIILLYLNILHKEREIPVDFLQAHKELQVYLKNPDSWVVPPLHLLILKKK